MSLFRKKKDEDTDSFHGSFSIPDSRREWIRLATQSRLIRKSIHDLAKLGSGSKVKRKQFVLLRAIWPCPKRFDKVVEDKAQYHLDEVWNHAEQMVASSPEVQRYLSLVDKPDGLGALTESQPSWPGAWALVLKWQKRCVELSRKAHTVDQTSPSAGTRSQAKRARDEAASETDFRPDDADPPNDEAVTNLALVLFLDAVSNLIPHSNFEVTIVRVAFEATFRSCAYRALTDGAIWIKGDTDDVRAIVEVKKAIREQNPDRIRMQETAEIVGWLKSAKPWSDFFGGYKILFAEDGDEVWIIFAKPSRDYPAYILQGTLGQDAFLEMETYGLFQLNVKRQMSCLCVLSAAIMLRIERSLQVQ